MMSPSRSSPATVFGIVGRSGSGKTTLTRLIAGLYPVQQGLLRIDGYDSRELDLVHLRRNLGLVLQDNFLFRGTVRENIACVKRDATFRRGRAGGAARRSRRIHRAVAARLRHHARGERLEPLRRSEAAACDRPGADHQSAHTDP